jgi:uncharacterized surface protein with fasciclin (FAS1) repeats
MSRIRMLVLVVVPLVAALLVVPVAWGQDMSPSVTVQDQAVENGTVTIQTVVSDGPGWIVIHVDDNGQPGEVIGYTALSDGENTDVSVEIDTGMATETLYAMLHTDDGEEGTYEFPDADPPAEVDGQVVVQSFMVTGGLEEEEAEEEAQASADIVDTAIEAGNFETLVSAIQAAELEDTLRGAGPFTVFAPTDQAFNALPDGRLEELLDDPTGELSQILLYHVVSGRVMAADVTDGMEVETVQGSTLTFSVQDGDVMVNDANVVSTDVEASNGVIHAIDAVLIPPEEGAEEEEEATETPAEEDEEVLPETGAGTSAIAALTLVVGGTLAVAMGFLLRRTRTVRRARRDDSDRRG